MDDNDKALCDHADEYINAAAPFVHRMSDHQHEGYEMCIKALDVLRRLNASNDEEDSSAQPVTAQRATAAGDLLAKTFIRSVMEIPNLSSDMTRMLTVCLNLHID